MKEPPAGAPKASESEVVNGSGLLDALQDGPFGLVVCDGQGSISWANATFLKWLGVQLKDLRRSRTFQDLLTPGGRIYFDTHVRPLLHVQDEASEIALELVRNDGDRMAVLVNFRLRVDEETGQQVVDTVVFDATNRRSYEQELLSERRTAERSEARLQVMYDVATGLAYAFSVEDIVAVVAERAAASFSGARCSVWMLGVSGRSVARVQQVGGDAVPLEVELPEHAPALDRLAAGEILLISDGEASHSQFPILTERMVSTGVVNAIVAPLIVDGLLRGAISYGFTERHEFDEDDLRAVSGLANQTVQALRRVQLVDAELRSAARLAELLDFTTGLSGALRLDDVIDHVANGSRKMLGAIGVRVALSSDDGKEVEFIQGIGVGGRVGVRVPIDTRSIGCTAIRTGKMQTVGNRRELEQRFPESPLLAEPEFGRAIAVPLIQGEKVLGAWVLAFSDPGPFNHEDIRLIELFAAEAGLAAQRAALHDAGDAARIQNELRWKISEALNRATTTTEVGRVITGEGRNAFGAAGLVLFTVDPQDPSILTVDARVGLDDAAVIHALSAQHVAAMAGLDHSISPRFVVGAPEVAAALAGVVDDVDWEAVALLPLGYSGQPLGLVIVGFDGLDAFRSASQVALAGLAAEASVALGRAWRSDADHDIAITLQRSLLPVVQPLSEGWTVTTAYEPASELLVVGGDLFDVTELDDGRVVLLVGDVVGHGLEAAASMGLLRSAAKALALVRSGPAAILDGLQAFAAVTPGVDCSSLCCVEVRPDGGGRYACAGHPYPVLRHADGRTELLCDARSPLLGTSIATPSEASMHMTAGSTLVVYTDGLIERRRVPLDHELDRLQRFLSRASFPETTAQDVVLEMIGAQPTQDDTVVVCLSRTAPSTSG